MPAAELETISVQLTSQLFEITSRKEQNKAEEMIQFKTCFSSSSLQ